LCPSQTLALFPIQKIASAISGMPRPLFIQAVVSLPGIGSGIIGLPWLESSRVARARKKLS